MRLDQLEGNPDGRVAWGSDIAAQMLRRFGIRYISLNPGASYRGFHDSLVNHLGNKDPGIILCMHEDHSVSIAHGYAKATGEPMAKAPRILAVLAAIGLIVAAAFINRLSSRLIIRTSRKWAIQAF